MRRIYSVAIVKAGFVLASGKKLSRTVNSAKGQALLLKAGFVTRSASSSLLVSGYYVRKSGKKSLTRFAEVSRREDGGTRGDVGRMERRGDSPPGERIRFEKNSLRVPCTNLPAFLTR